VVPTPEVTVVRRRPVVVVDVDVVVPGVLVVARDDVVVAVVADGCSGAFVFWTCDAANAVMPESDVRVIAVAIPRRIALDRTSGLGFERVRMRDRRPCAAPWRVSFA